MRVKEEPTRRSSSIRAATAFACLWSRSTGFFAAWITCLMVSQTKHTSTTSAINIRSLDVAKAGSLNLEVCINSQRNITYFCPYVFAFAITIGPNEQCCGKASLYFNVFRNWLLVLGQHKVNHESMKLRDLC